MSIAGISIPSIEFAFTPGEYKTLLTESLKHLEDLRTKHPKKLQKLRQQLQEDKQKGDTEGAVRDYNSLVNEYEDIFNEVERALKSESAAVHKILKMIKNRLLRPIETLKGEKIKSPLAQQLLQKLDAALREFDQDLGVLLKEVKEGKHLDHFKEHFGEASVLSQEQILVNIEANLDKLINITSTLEKLVNDFTSLIGKLHEHGEDKVLKNEKVQDKISGVKGSSDRQKFVNYFESELKQLVEVLRQELQESVQMLNYSVILLFTDFHAQEQELNTYIQEFQQAGMDEKRREELLKTAHKLVKYENKHTRDIFNLLRYDERQVRRGPGREVGKAKKALK